MNGRFLYEAMGGIGPDLIAEGQYLSLGKTTARKLLELAACLVVCLGLGMAAMLMLPQASFMPALTQPVEEMAQPTSALWLLPYAAAVGLVLAAWFLPVYALLRRQEEKWSHICSALCCMLSLLLQLTGLLILIGQRDWYIISNYVNLFLFLAAVTVALTIVLNGCIWLTRAKKWNRQLILCGIFLLLCLLSAIQYGFLVGRHKSWVALGGLIELLTVVVVSILYFIRLFTGKADQALYWGTMVLLTMQIIPFLLSIMISWSFCTTYHGVCMLIGIVIWRLHQKENRNGIS